jgi:hypothetical protein
MFASARLGFWGSFARYPAMQSPNETRCGEFARRDDHDVGTANDKAALFHKTELGLTQFDPSIALAGCRTASGASNWMGRL